MFTTISIKLKFTNLYSIKIQQSYNVKSSKKLENIKYNICIIYIFDSQHVHTFTKFTHITKLYKNTTTKINYFH